MQREICFVCGCNTFFQCLNAARCGSLVHMLCTDISTTQQTLHTTDDDTACREQITLWFIFIYYLNGFLIQWRMLRLYVTDHLYFHCQYNRYNYILLVECWHKTTYVTLSCKYTHCRSQIERKWMNACLERAECEQETIDGPSHWMGYNFMRAVCVIGIDQSPVCGREVGIWRGESKRESARKARSDRNEKYKEPRRQ